MLEALKAAEKALRNSARTSRMTLWVTPSRTMWPVIVNTIAAAKGELPMLDREGYFLEVDEHGENIVPAWWAAYLAEGKGV